MKNSFIPKNLRRVFMAAACLAASLNAYSQAPQGFNYQAIARDANGNPIINNSTLQVKLAIQTDTSATPAVIWEELHNPVKTNSFGMFTLVIGTGVKQSGTASAFSAINWSVPQMFLRVQVYHNNTWKPMGKARLWTVPYAMVAGVAGSLGGPIGKLSITGTTSLFDEALFEIKNKTGQTVFAVYNEGIRAYVDNGAKGSKGGFAIGGFGDAKASSQPLMIIHPDSARIYVDETNAKGSKGGFAIGGFDNAKTTTNQLLYLGLDNYLIGHSSGKLITDGVFNSTLGYQSGKSLTQGSNNVFMGYQSGYSTTTGYSNIFIGTSSGFTNSTGYWNIMLGRSAGEANTSGNSNIIIGDWAGKRNTTGFRNVLIGDYAGGFNTIGENNIFIGANAGNQNTEGNFNVFIGTQAGEQNTAGQWNTILGYLAGNSNTTNGSQVLLGYMAGNNNTGGWNTMVGSLAGEMSGTAYESTYVGLAAGQQASGNRNVFIGRWAGRFEGTNSNKLIIETNYEGTDNLNNALVYGDFIARTFRINGEISSRINKISGYAASFANYGNSINNWGIKITSGSADGSGNNYPIDFYNGSGAWEGSIALFAGTLSVYNVSDKRLKENIKDSQMNAVGLLGQLPVVEYNYSKSPGVRHTGYIAQDAARVFPQMVLYNDREDTYATSYTTLIPVLHKAIIEQQQQIDDQARKIAELESLVRKLLEK